MNKFINYLVFLFAFLIPTNLLSAQEWYSKLSEKKIQQGDIQFFKEKENNIKNLFAILQSYRLNIITRNFQELYLSRSELYRKIVPFESYQSKINIQSETPCKLYFSLDGSQIRNDRATIKTYYITRTKNFYTCDETTDIWTYDEKILKWVFISNTLHWGSPIVIEDS